MYIIHSFFFYAIYAIFGIWFKGCVYDINDNTHTPRKITLRVMVILLFIKMILNTLLALFFCFQNKISIKDILVRIFILSNISFLHIIIFRFLYFIKSKLY